MNGLLLLLPVWGAEHVARATSLLLPCLLAPGNLPALIQRLAPVHLVIYTSDGDAPALRADPALARAAALGVSVEVNPLGPRVEACFGERGGSTAAKECHNFGLQLAYLYDCGFVPLCADEVASNNVGEQIVDTIVLGKRALLHLGYRLQAPLRRWAEEAKVDGVVDVSPQQLSAWHLSLMGMPAPVPADPEADWSMSWSTASGTAYSAQGFHLSCRFVYPDRPKPVYCNGGTDQDLAGRALTSPEQVRLLKSSLDMVCAGIEAEGATDPAPWREREARTERERMAEVMRDVGDDFNRAWLRHTFWTEDGRASAAEKAAVEAYQRGAVARLEATYKSLYGP